MVVFEPQIITLPATGLATRSLPVTGKHWRDSQWPPWAMVDLSMENAGFRDGKW